MNRAFEIRLYPTKLQEQKLNQTFGACRFMYNCTLFQKQKAYTEKLNKLGQGLSVEPIYTGSNRNLE